MILELLVRNDRQRRSGDLCYSHPGSRRFGPRRLLPSSRRRGEAEVEEDVTAVKHEILGELRAIGDRLRELEAQVERVV
jgi:hypothetical protein